MFSRAIVVWVLTTLLLSPVPAVRARHAPEERTPSSSGYTQDGGELHSFALEGRLVPFPWVKPRTPKAGRLLAEAASFAAGRAEPNARRIGRATRFDGVPVRGQAGGLTNATAAICTVTTRADNGPGSLRVCLVQAAANGTILFDPAIFPPASPMTIAVASALPRIIVKSLTIDGSHAGVVLDGSAQSTGAGLVVDGAEGAVIRGLQILNFRFGIALIGGARSAVVGGDRSIGSAPLGQGNLISGSKYSGIILQDSGTANNQVAGNDIGTDRTGTKALPNGEHGVAILLGASGNTVGGETAELRNLISGNLLAGVLISGSGTSNNRVTGNTIGTDAAGVRALANQGDGVVLTGGASANIIGGSTAGLRNLISGNGDSGVWLEGGSTTGNQVLGNIIGADAAGAGALGNGGDGVFIGFKATGNVVGGDIPGAANLISGNGGDGVWIQDTGTTGNRVQGNFIGTDLSGFRAIPNAVDGVLVVSGAANNLVGGETSGAGNLISGNHRIGVNLGENCTGNRVLGNTIGADASGAAALGNGESGVLIGFSAHDNAVGGETTATRNLISGNGTAGVLIKDTGTTGNRVIGNMIGTDASGTQALGNASQGVFIGLGAQNNTIGGAAPAARNLISGNGGSGILLDDAGTTGNEVLGNFIGVDATGLHGRSNGNDGITISGGAGGNVIGGDAAGAGNLISGNADRGITIEGQSSNANRVLGNRIGTDATGMKPLANPGGGIVIMAGARNNVVGGDTPGARNLISGNDDGNAETDEAGVFIQDAGTAGNRVSGNYVGVDATGAGNLGNGDSGIVIASGAHDTVIGGETPAAANVIGGNGGHGIVLQQAGTAGNRIIGNYIGTDVTGAAALLNHNTGIFIGFSASNNVVGGEEPGARNLINGGVLLQNTGTSGNRVLGNYIGTDVTGGRPAGNPGAGVGLLNGPSNNVVGGETPAARNIIAGNAEHGVFMEGAGTTNNAVKGNYIGVDVTGTRALGNVLTGVIIMDSAGDNLIGGNTAGARNVISGNGLYGIQLQDPGTSRNRVQGNYIGTDANGTTALPNHDGVVIMSGASDNLIGGELPPERNLISGNTQIGVNLSRDADYAGAAATGNRVEGNYIGTDVTGSLALGNGQFGVHMGFGVFDNVVGGDKPGMRNIISGNGMAGVFIKNPGTTGNRVVGNTIGADVSGSRPAPNALDGVVIGFAASGNLIGGEAPGEGNLIGGNGSSGVWIQNSSTTRNRVAGNTIGGAGLGNQEGGVVFTGASQGNTLGPNNTIVHNLEAGVIVSGETTLRNTITRSAIHHNSGPPIDFADTPAPAGPVGAPDLESYAAGSRTLTGSACAGCRVEIFANPDAQPAGTVYLAAITASAAGGFTVTLNGAPPLSFLGATATDPLGTTSEFSSGLNTNRTGIYLPTMLR